MQRLGSNEMDIRRELLKKQEAQPIPADFQAAIDHFGTTGEVSAVETSRGT